MPKDPKRWQETLISSPFASLTKQDVHDYYADPAVRNQILKAVRGTGSGETILRQSFAPERVVLRRKDHRGSLINLNGKKEFDAWNQMRMTEVHPVFGTTTNTLLADIDPGKNVPWNTTKNIAETIAKTMASEKDVKDVKVQFSGDDGFYVQGILKKKMDVNEARNRVKQLMGGLAQRPDVTLAKAKVDQIRIDTTPLKNRGSIKAPYSLSAQTGLVAAPVSLEDLGKVKREDFKIDKVKMAAWGFEPIPGKVSDWEGVRKSFWGGAPPTEGFSPRPGPIGLISRMMGDRRPMRPRGPLGFMARMFDQRPQGAWPKQAEDLSKTAVIKQEGDKYILYNRAGTRVLGRHSSREKALAQERAIQVRKKTAAKNEFAPGIPMARKIDTIPSIKNKAWTLSIQQHDAKKAGKHYDVRLVDSGSQKAHSFAVPRGRLPTKRDRMLLAIQQPTHTADYALNFEGKIPAGTYGAGDVKIKLQEPVNVIKANADRIHFERPNGRGYVLFRTQGNNWGFKQKKI